MWILKGILAGTSLFIVGSVFYLYITLFRPRIGQNVAIALSVIKVYTIWNPIYWVAFAAALVLGCALTCRFAR